MALIVIEFDDTAGACRAMYHYELIRENSNTDGWGKYEFKVREVNQHSLKNMSPTSIFIHESSLLIIKVKNHIHVEDIINNWLITHVSQKNSSNDC